MKNVLIAHQSSIPHYRVPFYNALTKLKPNNWRFEVVFDPGELSNPKFFKEKVDPAEFDFPTYRVRTYQYSILSTPISYQTFVSHARKFDLLILENAVNNLTYPLSHCHKFNGKKIVYWGHGKDRSYSESSFIKETSEFTKLFLVRNSDGFFAYTSGVREYLLSNGIPGEKIFVLNNTIDIIKQRSCLEKFIPQREIIREEFNLQDKKVLLFVGRFTENKRIDFIIESFTHLNQLNNNYHLLMVGSGGEKYQSKIIQSSHISYLGTVTDLEKLAPIYIMSDLFVFPGSVGLGPLQALCYDLPVITIHSDHHMPEIEYLTSSNSVLMDKHTGPEEFAHEINSIFNNGSLEQLKSSTWSSIQHLTIENMATNFIDGVNTILEL